MNYFKNKSSKIALALFSIFLLGCDPNYKVLAYNPTNDTIYFSIGQKIETLPYVNADEIVKYKKVNDTCLGEPGYFLYPHQTLLLFTGNISYGPTPFDQIKYLKIHSKKGCKTLSDKNEVIKMVKKQSFNFIVEIK
jgi:hypothetical protein